MIKRLCDYYLESEEGPHRIVVSACLGGIIGALLAVIGMGIYLWIF
jgi:hypothetical protein